MNGFLRLSRVYNMTTKKIMTIAIHSLELHRYPKRRADLRFLLGGLRLPILTFSRDTIQMRRESLGLKGHCVLTFELFP